MDIATDSYYSRKCDLNTGGYEAVARYALNETGRDFVVGDIHGMFSSLQGLLDEVNFNESTDRLFSVGDLVDRGPESTRSLEWLAKPWFYACRGNHEQFALEANDPDQYELWVNHNGGRWWTEIPEDERSCYVEAFAKMPLAMEVETRTGRIGIVHADIPREHSWDTFVDLLESGHEGATFFAMWSRNRIASVDNAVPVEGQIKRVYCGHTPTRNVIKVHNVFYIDTGAVYCTDGYEDARLTMIEIHPMPHQEFKIYTHQG